jgi:hypothetical protein
VKKEVDLLSKKNSHFLNRSLLVLALCGLFMLASERFAIHYSSPAIAQAPVEGERKAQINIARGIPIAITAVKNIQNEGVA